MKWSESLPKKREVSPKEAARDQRGTEGPLSTEGGAAEGTTENPPAFSESLQYQVPSVYEQVCDSAKLRDDGLNR